MSRSYYKTPYVVDRNSKRRMKKVASRITRRKLNNSDELLQGSKYKRHFESWDICDFRWYWSEEDAIKHYYSHRRRSWFYEEYPTLEDWLKYYRKGVVYK